MKTDELLAILRKMSVRSEEIRSNMWFLEKATDSMAFNLIAIFNYGYMMGKRDERAKRKVKIDYR